MENVNNEANEFVNGISAIAETTAIFYLVLIKNGVPDSVASHITAVLLKDILDNARRSSNECD